MYNRPLARLGVVGLGAAGTRHAHTIAHHLTNAQLVAISDRDDALARSASDRYAARRLDYTAMLADSTIDGVVIATPTPLHPGMIEQAAAAGKHVFCEKPLGLDLVASAHALGVAAEHGIKLQVGFVRRFEPDWRDAYERVRTGEVGQIYYFRAAQRDKLDYPQGYIGQVGNFFQDVLVHEFDLARWLVGEVIEVNAWGVNTIEGRDVPDGEAQVACVQLRFATGAVGTIDGTMLSGHGYDCHTEILGTQSLLRVGFGSRTSDVIALSSGRASTGYPTDFRRRFELGFIAELEHFANAILADTQPEVTGRDGLAASAIADAASRSFASGGPAPIGPIDPPASGGLGT